MVIDRSWNPTNRIELLSQMVISSSSSYYNPPPAGKFERHQACTPYLALLDLIKSDKELVNRFEERSKAEREAQELHRGIDRLKGAYDTSLLETIAQQPEPATEVSATRAEFKQKTSRLNELKGSTAALETAINASPKVVALWARLASSQSADRQALLEELRTLNFWYPVKKLGMQLIFLLPLLAVFYFWNSASIRKNRGLQTLVSSHLLVVSFIPIFCKLLETIYDIIPKKLLYQLMEFLKSMQLVAVWHYLIIALAIGAALFLIYIFQKKLFSREKLIVRRISRGECQQCGKRLPAGANACPFCGFVQFRPCHSCGRPTDVHGKFCRECGAEQER